MGNVWLGLAWSGSARLGRLKMRMVQMEEREREWERVTPQTAMVYKAAAEFQQNNFSSSFSASRCEMNGWMNEWWYGWRCNLSFTLSVHACFMPEIMQKKEKKRRKKENSFFCKEPPNKNFFFVEGDSFVSSSYGAVWCAYDAEFSYSRELVSFSSSCLYLFIRQYCLCLLQTGPKDFHKMQIYLYLCPLPSILARY